MLLREVYANSQDIKHLSEGGILLFVLGNVPTQSPEEERDYESHMLTIDSLQDKTVKSSKKFVITNRSLRRPMAFKASPQRRKACTAA